MQKKFDLMYIIQGRLGRPQSNFLDFQLWKSTQARIFKMASQKFFCEHLKSWSINVIRQIFSKAFSLCGNHEKPQKQVFCYNSPPDGVGKNESSF